MLDPEHLSDPCLHGKFLCVSEYQEASRLTPSSPTQRQECYTIRRSRT
jgi:hypothetical protein